MVLAAVKIAFLAAWTLTSSREPLDLPPAATHDTATGLPLQEISRPEPVTLAEAGENGAPAPSSSVEELPAQDAGSLSDAPAGASAQSARPEPRVAAQEADALQAALIEASSRSALSVAHVFSPAVAQAADLPPVPNVAAPAPMVRPMASPVAPERGIRPDEVTPQAPPAPTVGPYVSPDSAVRKQAEINRREQELLGLQQQMETRMGELRGLENRLQGMLQDADSAQASKFKQLVDMYANMKPRVAAQALTNMDEIIAVKILTGMKSKESGEVLSYMDPVHAARLSEVMSKMQM